MAETAIMERTVVVHRGRRLEYFTVIWNALEGLVAVIAGAFAGSISLVGFGIDSFIEVTSGAVLFWRMSVDADVHRREKNERRALKIVGSCFLALAVYITYESTMDLWSEKVPEHSSTRLGRRSNRPGARLSGRRNVPRLDCFFAVAAIYVLLVIVGHAVMRMVSGPAQG